MNAHTYRTRHWFPECFIWEVFFQMAKACTTLANGPTPPDPAGMRTAYVHRDIKPENSKYSLPTARTQICNKVL